MSTQSLSRFKAPLNPNTRPLYAALAHCLAAAKVGDEARQALLFRHFMTLSMADRLLCQGELHACRAARRGELQAVVS